MGLPLPNVFRRREMPFTWGTLVGSHRRDKRDGPMTNNNDAKILRFGLDGVAVQDRPKVWIDTLKEFFYDCDFRLPADFALGEFKGGCAGDLSIARMKSDAALVSRTKAQVAQDALDSYFVLLPAGNQISFNQRGKQAILGKDQFSLVDTNDRYDYVQKGVAEYSSLILPGKTIRQFVPQVDDIVALTWGGSALSKMFHSTASSLCADMETIDDHAREIIGLHLVELLGLIVDGVDRTSNATPVRMAHYRRVLRLIDHEFKNPALTVDAIAIRLKLSKRYLQDIAAANDTTVSRLITARRIANAKRLLAYRCATGLAISEIAYSSGFFDVRYFNRVFKQATGLSPSHFMQRTEASPD